MTRVHDLFREQGFAVVPKAIDGTSLIAISQQLDSVPVAGAGCRKLLRYGWCQALAVNLRTVLERQRLLPADAVAVQCTLFEKSATRNWLVALHQDRSIPVRAKVESPKLSGWSEKDGDIFVQPPAAFLEQLTAVRLHLDACPAENGALRVVPGSHADGVLSQEEVDARRASQGEILVPTAEADVLLMKPLILHASSKATPGGRRRVLHFVYGPKALPFGLEWQYAI